MSGQTLDELTELFAVHGRARHLGQGAFASLEESQKLLARLRPGSSTR